MNLINFIEWNIFKYLRIRNKISLLFERMNYLYKHVL